MRRSQVLPTQLCKRLWYSVPPVQTQVGTCYTTWQSDHTHPFWSYPGSRWFLLVIEQLSTPQSMASQTDTWQDLWEYTTIVLVLQIYNYACNTPFWRQCGSYSPLSLPSSSFPCFSPSLSFLRSLPLIPSLISLVPSFLEGLKASMTLVPQCPHQWTRKVRDGDIKLSCTFLHELCPILKMNFDF